MPEAFGEKLNIKLDLKKFSGKKKKEKLGVGHSIQEK